MGIDLTVLVNGLFELGLGDGWLFLADDIDEQSFLVLACSILFDVLGPPLNVAAVLLPDLGSDFAEKDRDGLLLLFLPYLHRLALLDVPYQLAHPILP